MLATTAEAEDPPYQSMGPTLLSEQPVQQPDKPKKNAGDPNWTELYSRLEGRLGMLRSWRWSWWVHWALLAQYFLPRRYKWLVVPNRFWKGAPINDSIIDSTGLLAVRTCAAGLLMGLMNPSRPWFSLNIGVPWIKADNEAEAWLEDTQQKIYTVLAQSNFYTIMAQAFQDVTVFGTAPVIIYEDYDDVIRCYGPCAGEYYLATGSRLAVDTLYREFNFTIAEIVDMFGVENCPEQVTKLWQAGGGSLDVEMVVAHAIEPNFAIAPRNGGPDVKIVPGGFTYREVYWLKGQKTPKPLSVAGFNGSPFMAARWATTSNDAYGRSPCMDALGDNKQVQLETRRKAEFIEKGVRPPMLASPQLKNEPSSIVPGNITYVSTANGEVGFRPAFEPNAAWLTGITTDLEQVNARIEKALFVDLFMAITRMEGVQPRNELELTERNLERLQELGPFVQMFENEFAGPALKRIVDIMMRRRLLKPLPQSLRGVPLKFQYVSIMKLAQNATGSVAMKDVFATAGLLDSAAHSSGRLPPSRTIDLDKALKEYGTLNNFPVDLWLPDAEVQKEDQQRAQAQEAAMAGPGAMAAVTAAKTLSETQLGGGNALGAMLGQPRGAA